MRFESPWALLLLLAIAAVVYLHRRRSGRGGLRFSSIETAMRAGRSWRQRLTWLPTALRILAILALAVALARPQKGTERVRDESKGIAIEMVVDRSGSMGTEMDFEGQKQTRLDVVKKVFAEFVDGKGKELPGRPNDLVGTIAFARYPDTICPLTLAHGAVIKFLDDIKQARRQNEDGTAIGDAIALAAARLKTAEETLKKQVKDEGKNYQIKSKVIILLTDGQNNMGKRQPAQAAKLAAEWGIKIYAIGIGGGVVETPFGPMRVSPQQSVDEPTLKNLAETTGGIYRLAEDGEALRSIYKEIDRLEKSEIESIRFLDYREMFWPFALAALALVSAETLLTCTVLRRIP